MIVNQTFGKLWSHVPEPLRCEGNRVLMRVVVYRYLSSVNRPIPCKNMVKMLCCDTVDTVKLCTARRLYMNGNKYNIHCIDGKFQGGEASQGGETPPLYITLITRIEHSEYSTES